MKTFLPHPHPPPADQTNELCSLQSKLPNGIPDSYFKKMHFKKICLLYFGGQIIEMHNTYLVGTYVLGKIFQK